MLSKLGRSSKGTTSLQLSACAPTWAPLSSRCAVLPGGSWPVPRQQPSSSPVLPVTPDVILCAALADHIVPLHVDVSTIPPAHCTYCCVATLTFPIQNCYAAVGAGTRVPFLLEGYSAGCQGGTTAWEMLSSREREQCRAAWGWKGRSVSSRFRYRFH